MKTVYFFEKEKLIRKENQDVNGNLVEDSNGIAVHSFSYGNLRYTIKEETFAKNGTPKANSEGIAKMIFAYDENCLKLKADRYECSKLEEFYDARAQLVELKAGIENMQSYAKIVREFDRNGNLIMESYFDKHNKPKKNSYGVAKYQFVLNELGEVVEIDQFGRKGKLKQKILYTFDKECRKISKDSSCNTSIVHLNKKDKLINKEILESIPYAKEITSYNQSCIRITSEPDECFEKKEFINSKNELIYAEYLNFLEPPFKSEIKLIKLKLSQYKIPYSAEFIK